MDSTGGETNQSIHLGPIFSRWKRKSSIFDFVSRFTRREMKIGPGVTRNTVETIPSARYV